MLLQEVGKKKIRKCRYVNTKKEYEKDPERRKRSLKLYFTFSIHKERKVLPAKASLYASFMKRASLAVETALVLPLFFMGMVTMISFMDIYKIQTEHLTQLCEKAKQTGMYAYSGGNTVSGDITLPDIYSYEPIGGLIPLPRVVMFNRIKIHPWTGVDQQDNFDAGDSENMEKMVYVTETGSVYHKNPDCSYLNVSLNQVSGAIVKNMKNQYGEHYTACETCSRGQDPAGVVYITGQGNRYHNLESCSGLKRTVRLVKESEAEDLKPCSRCG